MRQPSAGRAGVRTRRGGTLAGVLAVLLLGGCFGARKVYAPGRVVQTPPLSWRSDDGMFELTMEAPSTGWRLEYDTPKRSRDGLRLLFTVRRPDPGMIYPAAVVRKHVLTDQRAEPGTRVWIRVLDHDETRGLYSPTDHIVPQTEDADTPTDKPDPTGP